MKEGREKEESEQDWTYTQGVGELEQGSDWHIGVTAWDRGVAFEAVGEYSSYPVTVWIEWDPQSQSVPQPYIPWKGTEVPWNVWWLRAGAYGLESNLRAKSTVDSKDMAQGDLREKTAVVNAFGRK